MKRRPLPTWLPIAALLAGSSACNDEILTDVDIPRDASSDRGTDAPKEGASSDTAPDAPTTDADSNTDAPETDETSDSQSAEPE